MSINTIITNTKTILEGVSGIGIVHNRERFWKTEKEFLDLFRANNKINGWMITFRSGGEEREALTAARVRHNILIGAYYGLDDANSSEVTFRGLVESVCSALRVRPQLNGAALMCSLPQKTSFRIALLGTIVCHYAEIRLEAEELIEYTPIY